MKLFPLARNTYQTKLSPEEVERRLSSLIRKNRGLKFDLADVKVYNTYKGRVKISSFSIRREITGRNSFVPQIDGSFSKNGEGTLVKIKMRPEYFITTFMVVFWSIVLLTSLATLIRMIVTGSFQPFIIMPFGMFVFMWIVMILAFKHEEKISDKDFKLLFEVEEA